MLKTRDLVLVRAIAEHGSLARAARVLAMGQPALTRGLAGLEARLRGPLFERSRRGVVPTDLCRALLAEAGEILDRLERLDRHLAEVRGLQVQTLSISAGGYSAESIAVTAAARMVDLYPNIRLRLATANWAEVPRSVREREAAIGIADLGDLGEAPDLQVERLHPMPAVFLVRPGHPLAAPGEPLDLARIMASPFVFLGRAPRRIQQPLVLAREQARQAGQPHPAFPAIMLESPAAAIMAVQASNAVAGTTIVLAEAAIAAGQVVALPWRAPWMEAQLGILRLHNHQPSHAEAAFLDLLRTADADAARRGRRFLAAHGFEPAA
ncbi:LysR family transcriptional regulator [Dankookia sp. GCM10030260]|uniref:LysR family transcriptional regulator n=1 Tax=Dankookia sp. GCM10030260 TaxID=3273390 RepID=UPI00360E0647